MKVNDVQNMLGHLYNLTTEELGMLDYLVEWARIKFAAEAYTPAQIELASSVRKVFDLLNETAESKNIHLQSEIKDNITVFADGKMLLSILQNIVSNSIKHTARGGKVTAYVKRKKDKIIVEIKDTGIGMSKEVLKQLFAPQIDTLSHTRKEIKGAGIGLLLIKGFVNKNGGEIWVESTEGKGTSFFFSLPAGKT
jgi:two-component system CheB/CheR fusion protein